MATVLVARSDVPLTSSEKDELSLDLKDTANSEPEVTPITPEGRRWFWSKRTSQDLDGIATRPSVFDDPTTLELYRPPSSYENAHRFDPAARWTWREEQVCTLRTLQPSPVLSSF